MRADKLEENLDKKYDRRAAAGRHIRDLEQHSSDQEPDYYKKSESSSDNRGKSDVLGGMIRQNEALGSFVKKIDPAAPKRPQNSRRRQFFKAKNLRGKSSMITILFLLFGGGGFLTVLFSPSIAIVEMKEVLTHSLNDQLHAVDSRSASILRAKMKKTTSGSCGLVKIKCRFATMSDRQVKQFEKNNSGIKIDRENIKNGRGKISKITFIDNDGVTVIDDATKLHHELRNNPAFIAAWTGGYNPKYKTLGDPVVRQVLTRAKATKNEKITGNTDEERQKSLNRIAGGLEDTHAKAITPIKDKDGNTTYVDENGKPIDPDAVKSANDMEKRVEKLVSAGGTTGVLKNAVVKSVAIDSVADTSCSLFNTIRRVSSLAKVIKKYQAIRFALALVLTMGDKIKAGDATEDEVSFAGSTLMATQPESQVLDESKLATTDANSKPPTMDNPNTGNAFDSKGFKIASGETVGKLSANDARFSLGGGGAPMILDTVTSTIARMVNGGNPNPKEISKKCRYIQSPFVRVGAFAAGIATGVATFGTWTLASGVASFALQLASPLIESQLGEMIAGDVFKDIDGYDSGNAAYVGTAGLLGDVAQSRGMAPVTTQGGQDYLAKNRETTQKYAAIERYMARTTPLDITNPYSFLGSMVFSLVPTVQQSRTNASMAIMNIASLVPKTFASIIQPSAGAVANNYFGQCNDMMYQSIGITAGPFCEVRYWMSDKELAMNPLENAQWMADTGNIDPASDTGEAKDNGQPWNYVKFLHQCAHRTTGWGEEDPENPDSGDGSACFDPAYQELNEHFRVYTMDQSIQISMDQPDQSNQPAAPGTTGFADGQKGPVGSNGWAFPTLANDTVTNGFHTASDPADYNGVSIAAKNPADTAGQPIFAAYGGRVMAAGPSMRLGNWIVIEHQVNGRKMSTVYGHMAANGVFVNVGDKVKAGQEIGRIGGAGSGDSTPHLLFELWQGSPLTTGTAIDPAPTIEAARASAGVSSA